MSFDALPSNQYSQSTAQLSLEVNIFDDPPHGRLPCAAFRHGHRFSQELLGVDRGLILHLGVEAVVALKIQVENFTTGVLPFPLSLSNTDDAIG